MIHHTYVYVHQLEAAEPPHYMNIDFFTLIGKGKHHTDTSVFCCSLRLISQLNSYASMSGLVLFFAVAHYEYQLVRFLNPTYTLQTIYLLEETALKLTLTRRARRNNRIGEATTTKIDCNLRG